MAKNGKPSGKDGIPVRGGGEKRPTQASKPHMGSRVEPSHVARQARAEGKKTAARAQRRAG
ncbi:MAG: hypothetical protein ACKVS8_09305 [Phycisphaerales bacterium]